MAKKKREEIEIEEFKAPLSPVSPLFSNVFALYSTQAVIMIDFGFAAPSYDKPYNIEDDQVARICLPWDSAKNLRDSLNDAISDRNKEKKPKRRTKSKE